MLLAIGGTVIVNEHVYARHNLMASLVLFWYQNRTEAIPYGQQKRGFIFVSVGSLCLLMVDKTIFTFVRIAFPQK